jgi:mRNA-degrading endonuclease RelE of RelBE toxin-antitoxin system
MHWQIVIRTRVAKQIQRLPRVVQQRYLVLQQELAIQGPVRGNWPNYSKLNDMRHHCHLTKGPPRMSPCGK